MWALRDELFFQTKDVGNDGLMFRMSCGNARHTFHGCVRAGLFNIPGLDVIDTPPSISVG
jgi:hypothetical protein